MGGPIQWDDPAVNWDDPNVLWDGGQGESGLPTITSVAPNTSDIAGLVNVTITGTNFGSQPATGRLTSADSGYSIPIGEVLSNVTKVLNNIQSDGATMLRVEAYWALLQPTNSHSYGAGLNVDYDAGALDDLDSIYNGCVSRSIIPLFTATYAPDWTHPGHSGDKVPPTRDLTNYADVKAFGAFLAARYPKAHFEWWNEANNIVFWKQPASTSTTGAVDSPDVAEYSKSLIAFHAGVKSANPKALVVTSGCAPASGSGGGGNYDPRLFLAGILTDAPNAFDHVGHHPYMWVYNPNGTQDWNTMRQTADLWALMKAANRSDADVWGTEASIISRPDDSGTDPSSENGVGGYASGAPGGSYNTSSRAITNTLAKTRATQAVAAWTGPARTDATVGRQYTGPFCVFRRNDLNSPTDWSGSDENHFGGYEGPGLNGAPKPHQAVWNAFFAQSAPAANSNAATSLSVAVGGTPATIVSNTDTQIVITVPAHAAGTVDVIVTTQAGPSVPDSHSRFTYTQVSPPGAPTVTGLFPSFGPFSGGTHVTVVGTDLDTATAVSFGGTAGTISGTPTSTSLIAIAPAHAAGVVDVTVTNPSGPSGVSTADHFTYTPPTPPTPTGRQWKIMARNATGVRGQIEDYAGIVFVKNHNDVGTWTDLRIPADSPIANVLAGPAGGIVILADDKIVFSGPVRDVVRAATDNGVQQLVLSGVDDNFWLRARLAHPTPDQAAFDASNHYGPAVYDTRTGIASTVMGQYVAVNAGVNAVARRRIANLSVAPDPVVGGSVTGNGRWQTVLEVLQQLALQSVPAVTFDVLQSANALLFSVSLPTDHSREGDGKVVFSPTAGTLGQYTYERQAANANYVYAGGAGSAQARLINEMEDPDDVAQWGLVEEFLDRRDIAGVALLRQAAAAEVLQQAGIFRTDLGVIDTAGVQWGVDYDLGDRVTVVVDSVPLVELVRSVQVTLGPNGDTEQIVPSVSSPSRKRTVQELHQFSILRDLASRVANLERNL